MTKSSTSTRIETKQQAIALLQGDRLIEARDICTDLCRSGLADAEVHALLGRINGKLGKLTDAAACLREAIRIDPDHAEAHLELGNVILGVVSGGLRRFAEAADCFRKAIALQPQMAAAHHGLGTALKARGKLAEAADSLREAIRIKPDLAEAHLDLGNVLYTLRKFDEAKECLQQAVRLKPAADTHFTLGKIQFSQGLMMEAAASYREALKLDRARADICNALGFTCLSLGRLNEAVESCRQAIMLQPDFLSAHNNLGKALIQLGRIEEAVSSFHEVLRLKPDFVQAAACLVAAYEMGGDFRKAGELLAPLIEKHPTDPVVALAFARLCRHIGRCREAADMVEKVLQQTLRPLERKELHFFAGKIHDAMNNYDVAFAHFQSANSLLEAPYDPVKNAADIDTVIASFSRDRMRHLPRASLVSDRPVFIVGMPRSGTSLVEQILSSHPQIHGAGELADIGCIAAQLGVPADAWTKITGPARELTGELADTLARDYLGRLDALSTNTVRVTDKMPHNFMHLGVINLLFPGARVIHCLRDPLDTCLSIYFQYFNASHPYASRLEHIGTHYRDYERLMAHWREVLDIPLLEVRYEDIVTRPDEMIPKLIEFCGLEWDPACLRFYENRRIVTTASYDQVRQPLHPKSIGRWKHYERHLGPLKAALEIQEPH